MASAVKASIVLATAVAINRGKRVAPGLGSPVDEFL
jgi:hypothetical protein